MAMHIPTDVRITLDGLIRSARNDIYPIVQADQKEGGYFGVTRAVLSYIDYLGALYGGYEGEVRGRRRNIATTGKALAFIRDIMGEVDPAYRANAELIYIMFRHGTVHLYKPLHLVRRDGRTLLWMVYKGDRNTAFGNPPRNIQHVIPQVWAANQDMLPVSITCLYDDLISSINTYYQKIQDEYARNEYDLLRNYTQVFDALEQPEVTNLTWIT